MDRSSQNRLRFSELLDVFNGGEDLALTGPLEIVLLLSHLTFDHFLHFRDAFV